MEDLKQKILADIHQTGFVTELLVGSNLIKQGWRVKHGSAYFDSDSGKSRELDIVAIKVLDHTDLDFHLIFYLVIQVKMSKRPWVIFSSPREGDLIGWSIAHCEENFIGNIHLPFPEISRGIMREGRNHLGTAFHEAFKSPSEPSQIFESIVSVCKATNYEVGQFRDQMFDEKSEQEIFRPNGMKLLRVFIPIVILDGVLFETFLNGGGDVQIEKREFIPVDFTYSHIDKTSKYRSEDPISNKFYPDVITVSGMVDYLTLVDHWQENIFKKAVRNLETHIYNINRKTQHFGRSPRSRLKL